MAELVGDRNFTLKMREVVPDVDPINAFRSHPERRAVLPQRGNEGTDCYRSIPSKGKGGN